MSTAEALQTLHTATVSQHGLITTAQAARIGISRTALARLVDGEALARIRHGVYALPSSDGDPDQDLRAAWLSTDPRRFADERARAVDTPVVSHASASALHRMGDLIPIRHSFTAPQRKQTRQTDIRYHRAALDPAEITLVNDMPVTAVPRTLADLAAAYADDDHLASMVRDALSTSSATLEAIATALDAHAAKRGLASGMDLVNQYLISAGAPRTAVDVARFAAPALVVPLLQDREAMSRLARVISSYFNTVDTQLAEQISAIAPALKIATETLRHHINLPDEKLSNLAQAFSHIQKSIPSYNRDPTKKDINDRPDDSA